MVNPFHPPPRVWVDIDSSAVQPDLLLIHLQAVQRVDIENDPKCTRNVEIFDGQLPAKEYLVVILVWCEVVRIKASALALNNSVRLAGVKYHSRTPGERDSVTCMRKMQVKAPVLAQEQIAEGRSTVVRGIKVVLCAGAGHERHVT